MTPLITPFLFGLIIGSGAVYIFMQLRQKKTEAESIEAKLRLEQAMERLKEIEDDIRQTQNAGEAQREQRYEAEKHKELALQRVGEMEARIADWEKTREESMKSAKEAMFSTGGELFRKEAEMLAKKTMEEFEKVTKSVSTLQEQVSQSSNKTDLVWRSLSTPHAIGSFSEIGLENTLKNMGLEAGRDFIMQYSITGQSGGNTLRPDAVVFLPGGNLMVIDSKASKSFLELAEAEGTEAEEAKLTEIKKRMAEHLRSLASKGYKDAVRDSIKHAGIDTDIRHVMTLMFLHSEAAVEKTFRADSSLRGKAEAQDIIIAGPTGLAGALSLARYAITSERQSQNQQHIIEEVQGLLGAIATTLSHVTKVGNGMQSASKHFERFISSVNRTLLPKARRLHKLGVEVKGSKELPGNLASYHVLTESNSPLIEARAEEEES